MHLKAMLKAKTPKSSGKVPCAKKFKSKIENLRFTRLFKSVSQYCELNKVQQECLFVFVPRSDEFKYFDEMPLGEVLTVRLVVSLVLLRRLCNDDLMASATPSTRFPANFCYYCSNADNVQAVFFILFPPTTVHLRRLLAQQWGMCEVTMSCETCYQSSNAKEDHRGATPGASHRLDLEMLCTRL